MARRLQGRKICVATSVFLMVGFCAVLGIVLWQVTYDDDDGNEDNKDELGASVSLERRSNDIRLVFSQYDNSGNSVLTGYLAQNQPSSERSECQLNRRDETNGQCYQWDNGPRLEIYEKKLNQTIADFKCYTVKWDVRDQDGVTETPEDCFDMDYYWFGGFETNLQIWPVNDFKADSLPYITSDAIYHKNEYGDVVEPIFWSSSGVGIYIEETAPLYVSINHAGSKQLCLKGKVGPNTPFFSINKPYLQYDICKSSDITSLWKNMAEVYLPKPKSYPSLDVIRYPIWCTWASYKSDINQSTVLDFAKTIRNNNFSISQLEIDDEWSPHYGDMVFNTNKFPDAKAMIATLTQMGIPATIWVHWFFNNDSDAFQELKQKGYLVKEYDSDEPHLVSWWNGQNNAAVIDVTNPDAMQWYLDKLVALQQNYNVTSFKFDAGEVSWIIGRYKVKNDIATPNYMTLKYAEMTYEADKVERRQELRAGFRSQASSIMTRMLDRDSNWSHDLGLKTLIPCTLTFGLMGYPYVLADMIGGNAYGQDVPEPEIFIRWLQATVFMPILQFSLTPWSFNNQTVLDLTSKYIKLHEQYADKIINLTLHAQKTGEPINRPLWWIAPDDENALTTDSQFLLGDDLMVAPILDKGATSRDIYLPKGLWHDELRDVFVTGGQWLRQYRADLDELPYFTKVDEDIVITKLNDAVSLERLNDHIRLVVRKDGKDNTLVLTGSLAQKQLSSSRSDCQLSVGNQYEGLCYQWDKGPKLEIYQNKMASNVQNFECVTVKWDVGNEAGVMETPEDCFDMDYYWFGGFEEDSQIWPVNDFQADSLPYITGDAYHNHEYGDYVEPIFWSSSGVGIYIEETTPLYVSINHAGSKQLCLKGKVGPNTPFFSTDKPYLQYDICKSPDITSLWKNMAEVYLPKPKSYPSLDVIRYPIWCTWASYKDDINQSTVLDFARTIRSNNFSISQLEIDETWTPHFGDMVFDTSPSKFPDPKAMIATLTQMGIPATIWVHWFFNNDSDAFQELKQKGYLVKEYDSDEPHLVSWWNGQNNAAVIDVTNPDAIQWYLDKLSALQQNYNITSFKFDAGEVKWIIGRYKVKNDIATPNYMTLKYAEMTYEADKVERRQEMRAGFRSQASSIMARMLDRDSNWSHDLGLKTLIPCTLTFGLMGYPYVLADMIGGNAYGQDVPEPEIFIRWLQATVFMPILQFSLTPWSFSNQTVLDLTSKYIKLHEQYADKIINLTLHAQKTGEPINRPLWWIAPDDENALTTDSQFLLGDDLMVAPILDKGATSRDIYLPRGLWHDELRDVFVTGGQWLTQYRAALDELPYFTKVDEDNVVTRLNDAVSLERHSDHIRMVVRKDDKDNILVLTGSLAQKQLYSSRSDCQLSVGDQYEGLCYQWDKGPKLEIYQNKMATNVQNFECVTVKWDVGNEAGVTETPEDCFDMDYYWFGGFEEDSQIWPVNDFQAALLPYITGDAYHNHEYGDVVEPIFWSSSGVGIYIEETTPLYVSINHAGSKQLCLKGKVGPNTPFFSTDKPYLQYDICKSPDITSLWKNMAEVYLPKPKSYPSLDVIRYPIWCTWASYKKDINQTTILDFARTIRNNNFSISQLEIDDEWSPHYGDMVFNTNKFPDPKAMITTLTEMGIPATIWVHWFFNNDSDAFQELKQKGYLVKEYDSDEPHLVSWWNGQNNAAVIDVTNPDAVQWYLDKIAALQQNYNITSFKFDAGEVKWLIGRYKVKNDIATPNYMTQKYAEMTFEADKIERRQELRAGFRSQASSIMTRMLDRDSNWSHDLGLKTLIPCTLTLGLMGYPYVLADMIGGNAYGQDVPEPEIFIRWLQATVFMPILQFSLTPWSFNNQTVLDLTSKYIKLHEQYADKIINLTLHAQKTGEPINRPLWWIAPDDEHALTTDSQFLLGDDLMVAPILDKGATSRDIYLPKGLWHDELRDVLVTGGQWLRQYRADLDELPYFTKVDEDYVVTRLNDAVSLEHRSDHIRMVVRKDGKDNTLVLTGSLAQNQPYSSRSDCQLSVGNQYEGLCYQWDKGPKLEIYQNKMASNVQNFECVTVKWDVGNEAGVTETPEDCFDMDYYWFGGFEEDSQIWPVNDFQADSLPYITGDAFHTHDYGDVVEPIFWSSSGVGIYIEETAPLYVSINHAGSKQLCLKGKVGPNTPFFSTDKPYLQYDICKSPDITSLWKNMAEVYLPKPKSYPSLDVIRYPIWCTWASYKKDINQTTILDFARTIRSNNFSISQLEIDDDWTPHYGDMTFNTNKFPDAKAMIATLTQMGIPATIWVHWFFNNDSDAFTELKQKGYLVKEYDSDDPYLVSWWNGQNNAAVIDVTNPDAVQWYLEKLTALQQNYNITSFKFDAGEIKWIPGRYKVKNDVATPNYISQKYAEMTYEADKIERRQELRTGFRSQASSIMMRMLDRDSNWSHDLALKTLIPCALTFGLMGYPYVLPDMIGGNAYGQDVPEPEIFIRWLQATVFMPILQFSLTPWSFNNQTVLDLTSKYIKLHEQYADKIINLTLHAQKTGEPINRPLWWIAPDDENAFTTDSQFLLGDDLMVAPILDKGATSRDIYLPKGLWYDELRNNPVSGGQWLRQYRAELHELPYFTKMA